jgi:mRNA interferase MazF
MTISITTPTPQRGEIYFVQLPNQPNDPHQPRPAVVISPNGRNRGANDIIVVPLTSVKQAHALLHVLIPKGEGGLPKESCARCEKVTTIDKTLLASGPLGAPIHTSFIYRIEAGIKYAVGAS